MSSYDFIETFQLCIIGYAVLSCIFSSYVILSYHKFQDLQIRVFLKYIYYISVADFFMSVSSFGFPPGGSVLCWIQGIAQIYFAVTSWLWTLVLSYTIYCVIAQGKIWFQLWHAQCLCWMLPLVLALLPLTTNTYSSGDPDLQWCLIVPRSGYPSAMALFWAYASFFVWLFVCILLMIYWGVMIQWRYWGSIASQIVRRTYEKVWLYPVSLALCWLLNVACISVPSVSQSPLFVGLSTIFGLSNGIMNAIIFMRYNGEIMQRWVDYFRGKQEPSGAPSDSIPSADGSSSPSMHSSEAMSPQEFRSTAIWYRGSHVFDDGDMAGEDLFPANHSTTNPSMLSARNSNSTVASRPSAATEVVLGRGSVVSNSSIAIRGDFEMTQSPIVEAAYFN